MIVSTVFPSVTGVAYIPMLTGSHPGDAGVPGLRWYDRSRQLPALLGHSRSYVGAQLRRLDHDLSTSVSTVFELVDGDALGAAAMVTRGLPRNARLDRGWRQTARAMHAHATGNVDRWASLEETVATHLVTRIRRERPRFVFAAFTGGDKAAHAFGAHSPGVLKSLKLVDHVVGEIRRDAQRDGRWHSTHLWVTSDHGHSPVQRHFDLVAAFGHAGVRVRSHPWTVPDRSDAAVMVSGNSMAHVYLGLASRERKRWSVLAGDWNSRIDWLWSHPAIDLVATWLGPTTIEVRRGDSIAEIEHSPRGVSYRPQCGNPLGVEAFETFGSSALHEMTGDSAYPDSVEQLVRLVRSERSGDLVISAAPGWDLRSHYEPVNHISSHGALHAAHMLVPLLGNRRHPVPMRRTVDLHGAILCGLGIGETPRLAGSFDERPVAGARS